MPRAVQHVELLSDLLFNGGVKSSIGEVAGHPVLLAAVVALVVVVVPVLRVVLLVPAAALAAVVALVVLVVPVPPAAQDGGRLNVVDRTAATPVSTVAIVGARRATLADAIGNGRLAADGERAVAAAHGVVNVRAPLAAAPAAAAGAKLVTELTVLESHMEVPSGDADGAVAHVANGTAVAVAVVGISTCRS